MKPKINLELEAQEVTDLLRLLSIAVWVRSEQLADLDHRRVLGPNDVRTIEPDPNRPLVPAIILDPHLLVVSRAEGDLQAGQEWWTKIKRLSDSMRLPEAPSWWDK